jgi:hypothetical protein
LKECFGHVIKDTRKLQECRGCEEREACRAIQWGQEASSIKVLPRARQPRPTNSSGS